MLSDTSNPPPLPRIPWLTHTSCVLTPWLPPLRSLSLDLAASREFQEGSVRRRGYFGCVERPDRDNGETDYGIFNTIFREELTRHQGGGWEMEEMKEIFLGS